MRADGEEAGVEPARFHGGRQVVDAAVELQFDAHVEDAPQLGVEHLARQAVLGDAEAHHAAALGVGLANRHGVARQAQVPGGGQPGRAGTDHQHVLAAVGSGSDGPAAPDRLVAEEALDGVDAHRFIQLAAVAGVLAGVVADAAHDRRQRVVPHQLAPGFLVVAGLGVEQPALDVLAGRAGMVAGRQAVDIDRPHGAPGAGAIGERGAGVERDGEGLIHGGARPRDGTCGCCGRPWPGCARWCRRPRSCRRGGRSASAAGGTPPPAGGGGSASNG